MDGGRWLGKVCKAADFDGVVVGRRGVVGSVHKVLELLKQIE